MGTLIPIGAQVEWELQQANTLLTNKRHLIKMIIFFLSLVAMTIVNYATSVCTIKKVSRRRWLHAAAWWSCLDVWMRRGGHLPSETWSERHLPLMMLFWADFPPSWQDCFISFFRINVCLSSTSKATSQGSVTTRSFIWFIYKPCPCASLSFCTHLAVHGRLHWSSRRSTSDVCKTTAASLAECLPFS